MAQQDALAFISKVSEDAALQKEVAGAKPEGWAAAAKKAGFNVTVDELKAASTSLYNKLKGTGQLSDADLAGVVGGATSYSSLTYQGLSFNTNTLAQLPSFKLMAW
jgi:predicted ribosomally synthesized peptide with nif11-like leader